MVTYEEFEKAELLKAEQQQKKYAAERRAAAEQQIEALTAANKVRVTDTRKKQKAQREKAVAAFTEEYAQNALNRALGERRWRQYFSEFGLTGSGLSERAVENTETQKQAADAKVSAESQEQIAALASKLTSFLAEEQAAREEETAKLRAAAEKDVAQNETSLFKAARERATRQYKAALSAAAKGVTVK